MKYRSIGSPRVYDQIDDKMVKNYDGAYVWEPNKWDQLRRWLIIGSNHNTFYVIESVLHRDNIPFVLDCLKENPKKYIDMIAEVRKEGLAPKQETCLYAYSLVFTEPEVPAHAKRYARSRVLDIISTGAQQAEFATNCIGVKVGRKIKNKERGWGRALRTTVAKWYEETPLENLAYQLIKYRKRSGISQANLIKLSHPSPGSDQERSSLLGWAVGKATCLPESYNLRIIIGYELARTTVKDGKPLDQMKGFLIRAIMDHKLPWEAVPTEWLNDVDVLMALAEFMPPAALVRQLPRFTWSGALASSLNAEYILSKLTNQGYIAKSRLHPLKVLQAYVVYGGGVGTGKTWKPNPNVLSALDTTIHHSMKGIGPVGKRRMIAVDVSGSMHMTNCAGMSNITPAMGAVVLAMTAKTSDPGAMVYGFGNEFEKLNIDPGMGIGAAISAMRSVRFGATDISLPMLYALRSKIPVDIFEIYTDYELNSGEHPTTALDMYKDGMGIDARIATLAMESYPHTVADPSRNDMMDFVGLDPSVPEIVSLFANGLI